MPKKSSKQKKPVAQKKKTKPVQELSDDQLERVAGGVVDVYLKLGGTPGPTQQPTESLSLNFGKISLDYKKGT